MILALAGAGYVLGSMPVAWIVTKLTAGRDLRELGSGNVGVMNVMVSVSRWAGAVVFTAEAAKGIIAVALARLFGASEPAVGVSVLAAIAGTRWSIWLRWRGGRGNTLAMAALLVVSWMTLLAAAVLWGTARVVSGRSFIASRVTLVLWPAAFGLIQQSWWALAFGAAISLLFLTTHRRESDDHLAIKARWPSLGAFLASPPRKWWMKGNVRSARSNDETKSGDSGGA
ncbi:MAG: glycerol-3-phosphate acyltransferase [Anaerolineae bacterium]